MSIRPRSREQKQRCVLLLLQVFSYISPGQRDEKSKSHSVKSGPPSRVIRVSGSVREWQQCCWAPEARASGRG